MMIELIELTDIRESRNFHVHPDDIRIVEPLDWFRHNGARARVQLLDGSTREVSQEAEIVLNRRREALSPRDEAAADDTTKDV